MLDIPSEHLEGKRKISNSLCLARQGSEVFCVIRWRVRGRVLVGFSSEDWEC